MPLGTPTRDQRSNAFGGNILPIIRADVGRTAGTGNAHSSRFPFGMNLRRMLGPVQYMNMNPEIQKSRTISPTNQSQRGAIASRESMMFDPRNSPSRSQFSEGYTNPIQLFAANSLWQGSAGASVKSGQRMKQPSLKAVSPFSRLPIPTRMPWDL